MEAAQPEPRVGQLVLVPFGRREVTGLIVEALDSTELEGDKIRDVIAVRHQLAPLSGTWIGLCRFAADYYQRPLGEVALPGLPKNLRAEKTLALDKALKKLARQAGGPVAWEVAGAAGLNAEQAQAVDAIAGASGYAPMLLYGVTGSGKTEVYLQAIARCLLREPEAQVLILVPEINLTPQLEENVRGRRVLNQPAGHLDAGESLQQAAVRETLEETGWHVELTHFLGVQQWTSGTLHFVRFAFAAAMRSHEPQRPLDAGILGTTWLTRDEIAAAPNLRSPMVLANVDDWLAGVRLPLDTLRYFCARP